MYIKILEKSGHAEVIFRRIATSIGPLKKKIKRFIRSNHTSEIASERNETKVGELKNKLENCGVNKGDIVIIHSSVDGLRCLGVSVEELLDLILDVFSDMTVVFATYPIEPIRRKETYKYNPKKTLCWTGLLPNAFLKRDGVFRSLFPYNTLAAKGNEAETMNNNNLQSVVPHGKGTPWDYCRLNHAKILFLGTTSREANTMAIHMIPDVLGDAWPIENWYEERRYEITDGTEKIEKIIRVQRGFWYQYVNEYKTDRILKENNLLYDISIDDITIEIVPDCFAMIEFLERRAKQGQLMYSIPKKYYKRKQRREG